MKAIYRAVAVLSLAVLCVAAVSLRAESAPPPRTDPNAIRKIVQDVSQKDGTKAVEFGMWQGDREILTTALGRSMTVVPAATNMHYRIGGIGRPLCPRCC